MTEPSEADGLVSDLASLYEEIEALRIKLNGQQAVVEAAESIFAFILTRSTPPSLDRLTKEIEPLGKAFVDLAALDAPLGKVDLTDEIQRAAWEEGWNLAHEPARCGHSRANYKDPAWGTPEYAGHEKCEFCDALEAQQAEVKRLRGYAAKSALMVSEMQAVVEAAQRYTKLYEDAELRPASANWGHVAGAVEDIRREVKALDRPGVRKLLDELKKEKP